MIGNILINLLGGYSYEQVDEMSKGYRNRINELNKQNESLIKDSYIFTLCKVIRGKRYKKIVLPENSEEFNDWLYSELYPSLYKDGTIVGETNFLNKRK